MLVLVVVVVVVKINELFYLILRSLFRPQAIVQTTDLFPQLIQQPS